MVSPSRRELTGFALNFLTLKFSWPCNQEKRATSGDRPFSSTTEISFLLLDADGGALPSLPYLCGLIA
jgi:hypothetical protein